MIYRFYAHWRNVSTKECLEESAPLLFVYEPPDRYNAPYPTLSSE